MTYAAPPPRRLRRWAARLAVVNLAISLAVVVLYRLTADEHWLATLLLFGPRWAGFAPLVLIAPLALIARSGIGLTASAATALIVAGPFMAGVVNFASPLEPAPRAGAVRFASFNADNKDCDRRQFQAFVAEWNPDVIGLQDADRIRDPDLPPGWRLVTAANGLKMAARHSLRLIANLDDPKLGPARGAAKFWIEFPFGDRLVAVLHLPTARPGLEAVLSRRQNGIPDLEKVIRQRDEASAAASAWLRDVPVVIGDFNLPPGSRILQRDWAGWQDAFESVGDGWGWTFHSRRNAVRIDRILFSTGWSCQAFRVGPDLGSSHRPVLADLVP